MIIVTGSIAYDYIMDFPGLFKDQILPEKLHIINLSFIANNFAQRRGGTAGNLAYTLALLKTPHILFSVAGKDFGAYKKEIAKFGVDTNHITIYKNLYTAVGFVMTDKNDNQIWSYFYGAAEQAHTLQLKKIATQDDLVIVGPQGAKGSMSFVKQCIRLKIPYLFDPGFILGQITDEELLLGITHCHYLIGNDYEISMIQKKVPNFASLMQDKIVITTLGKDGAMIQNQKETITINPAKPKKVVDPTGAGDAWRGGFLAGLERNLALATCGQMGAVAASFAIEHYGTQEHRYSKSQFTKRYKETYNQNLAI